MSFENLVDFWSGIDRLKRMPRTGWVKRNVPSPETVASHSFGTAIMACLMCESENAKVDRGKVLMMALFHDLAESVTGDITHHDERYREKNAMERKAMTGIVGKLSPGTAEEITRLTLEFMEGVSEEAKLVRRADKMDMFMTAHFYEKDGHDMSDFYHEKNAKYNTRPFNTPFSSGLLAFLKGKRGRRDI